MRTSSLLLVIVNLLRYHGCTSLLLFACSLTLQPVETPGHMAMKMSNRLRMASSASSGKLTLQKECNTLHLQLLNGTLRTKRRGSDLQATPTARKPGSLPPRKTGSKQQKSSKSGGKPLLGNPKPRSATAQANADCIAAGMSTDSEVPGGLMCMNSLF